MRSAATAWGLKLLVASIAPIQETMDLGKLVVGRKEIEGLFVVLSPVEVWRNCDCVLEGSLNGASPLSILPPIQ